MLSEKAHVAYISLAPIGAVFMATMNVFTVIIFTKKIHLQQFSLLLIVNICICDIFDCVVSNLVYAVNLLHPTLAWSLGNVCCKVFKTITMATNVAQIFSLCFVNADRLRRMIYFTDRQWNRTHGIRVLVVTWTASVCLTIPRLFLFKEKFIEKPTVDLNEKVNFTWNITLKKTTIATAVCKPDVGQIWYFVTSIVLFVLVFALPTIYIMYTTARAQLFMWRRRRQVHLPSIRNSVIKMNHVLALTFNLTAAFHLAIWSLFFILSTTDLKENIIGRKDLKSMNFILRCTILIVGSAKPILYVICLERFRNAMRFSNWFGKWEGPNSHTSTSSRIRSIDEVDKGKTTTAENKSGHECVGTDSCSTQC